MANEKKDIISPDGRITIPYFDKDPANYLDKTTFIFGGSSSGKTTIAEEILFICKDYIPNYLAIVPPTSERFYTSKLPKICIKQDLSRELLNNIWERQNIVATIYRKVNKLENILPIAQLTRDTLELDKIELCKLFVDKLIKKDEENPSLTFDQRRDRRDQFLEKLDKKLIRMTKDIIKKHESMLLSMNLTNTQKSFIKYLNINPRFALIIDDCSEKLEHWQRLYKKLEENIFESIVYKGRHVFITLIVIAHDDKLIDPKFRKNARNTIYTTSQSFIGALSKAGGGYSGKDRKEAEIIAKIIFGDGEKIKSYKKVCYVREDNRPFKYMIADRYPEFKIGCKSLWNMAEKIPDKKDQVEMKQMSIVANSVQNSGQNSKIAWN